MSSPDKPDLVEGIRRAALTKNVAVSRFGFLYSPPMFFRILWIFDALVSSVVLFFFFAGVTRETVTASNIGIWLALVFGLAAILGGSWFCRVKRLTWLGILLLLIPAIPAVLGLLGVLAIIVLQPDWR
jgi:hypothetical protein